ncbi:polysaccharide deacetylase family protein [Clostridium beijerinckii]|uniref:Peptidoglycan-N-acetylglucosamine deacetylase n=1 Tax=Clostridium beijerinckii TaxID=1520 RepID=A0A1S8S364_CLOBE|nr:polysaccharide deacetylase family protein [Clostridium beijerinckii]NMF07849.1 polysaccharide deacetylase [Clostridium beijerinckii]NRY58999.1 peptidoglycan/xylan/chitin deacetylase (PgdA/CDA1 family) [Clostridium beijerinckii]OOM59893.1 peptidoglycan-N-acetylglucosamine deacetylase [Clostridium beijerinckii]
MKNRIKFFLFLLSGLFVMFICVKNVSAIPISSNETTSENRDLDKKVSHDMKKVIYLTFDDGPSYKVTDRVLDILKEKDVKGTFFLIGSQIEGREGVVKRIYDEGNSIGLHTYTHKFNKIYCSEDKFIQEMLACRIQINNVIGISPNIIRFPGGSSKHLNNRCLKKLHDNNFKVYDWNMDNTDGLNPKLSPYSLYRKAIKGSEKLSKVILLLHCTDMNNNTCEALPEIIEYYKSQGYEFKTITEDTQELYFPISRRTFTFFENII